MPNASMHWLSPFVVAALFIVSLPAFATAQRTFVSSNGDDANACTITAPCRSFAIALAQTNANGELIVQDSAGYGPVTITTSVSIIAPAGVYAGISVTSGDGITINGSGIVVALRGLIINGQGGSHGIHFVQGTKLTIEDCEIANMVSNGINLAALNSTVTVTNTVMRDNGTSGVGAAAGSRIMIANSVLANNGARGVFASASGGSVTDVTVTHSTITGSPYGLEVSSGSGSTTRLVSDANVINKVIFAAFCFNGGLGVEVIYSPGNNTVAFTNGTIVSGGSLSPLSLH